MKNLISIYFSVNVLMSTSAKPRSDKGCYLFVSSVSLVFKFDSYIKAARKGWAKHVARIAICAAVKVFLE